MLRGLSILLVFFAVPGIAQEDSEPVDDSAPATSEDSQGEDAKSKISPEDQVRFDLVYSLFRRSHIKDPRISPDGSMVAYFDFTDSDNGRLVVMHREQSRKLILRVERRPGVNIIFQELDWIDNRRIAYKFKRYRTEYLGLSTLQFEGGQLVDSMDEDVGTRLRVIDPLPQLEKHAVIFGPLHSPVRNYRSDYRLKIADLTDAYRSSKYKWPQRVRHRVNKGYGWLIDTKGNVRAYIDSDEDKDTVTTWYWDKEKKNWKSLWEHSSDKVFIPVMLEEDEKSIIAITDVDSDYRILARFDITTRSFIDTIYAVEGADVQSVKTNARKTRLVSVGYVKDGFVQFDYLNDPQGLLDASLTASGFEGNAYIVDLSLDEKIALVVTSDTDFPGEVHVLNTVTGARYRVGVVSPWLDDYRLGSSQLIRSVSTDGETIESYLTIPSSSAGTLPPLIVMPHGGPLRVQDTRHFNSYAQYLAVLGYAVLQPNYRGSSGYGKSFQDKGQGQWGRLIEDDIESAVQAVVDKRLVDPNKICIFGSSYGGYSALISAVRRPDLYSCAASFAGVTDLPLLFHDFSLTLVEALREVLIEIVGNPDTEAETLVKYSPAFLAHEISIPVFLSHGLDDERVDVEHYYRMKHMLDFLGKDASFLLIERVGHGFDTIGEAALFLLELDRFLRSSLDLDFPEISTILRPEALGEPHSVEGVATP